MPQKKKRASQVYCLHGIPVLDGHLPKHRIARNAGRMDDEIEPPFCFVNRLNCARDRIFFPDIALDPSPLLTRSRKVQRDRPHTRLLEGIKDRAPDRARSTADDRNFFVTCGRFSLHPKSLLSLNGRFMPSNKPQITLQLLRSPPPPPTERFRVQALRSNARLRQAAGAGEQSPLRVPPWFRNGKRGSLRWPPSSC